MYKVLIASVVDIHGLGDALQCYIAQILLKKHIPRSQLILSVPNVRVGATLLPELDANLHEGLSTATSIGYLLSIAHSKLQNTTSGVGTKVRNPLDFLPAKCYKKDLQSFFHVNTHFIEYVRPSIAKIIFPRYDGGVICGHTIEVSAFFDDIITYTCARSIVNGPLITFPMSVSILGLKRRHKYIKLLKKSLERFDILFVRGRYSRNFLVNFLKIPKEKVHIGLDTGFGVRLLRTETNIKKQNTEVCVGIVPRVDYFHFYGKMVLYERYLHTIKHLIKTLVDLGVKVYLIPHTLKNPYEDFELNDEKAINDLLSIFDERTRLQVKVYRPKTIIDDVEIFSSLDMVITSRMHAGIISLAYGKPVVFFMPKNDTKVLDVLSTLSLNPSEFIVELFDPRDYENVIVLSKTFYNEHTEISKTISKRVSRLLNALDLPVIVFKKMLDNY